MVEELSIEPGDTILEPSAGTGNLLDAIKTSYPMARFAPDGEKPIIGQDINVMAIEINYSLAQLLRSKGYSCINGDFIDQNGNLGKFDRVIMNPPFEHGADIKHIKHAIDFLTPGGRLVALCANGPRQNEQLKPLAENSGGSWEVLPAGSFKNQGTGVNVAMMVYNS
jgi:16S rRNA G1207 methylase RsmC